MSRQKYGQKDRQMHINTDGQGQSENGRKQSHTGSDKGLEQLGQAILSYKLYYQLKYQSNHTKYNGTIVLSVLLYQVSYFISTAFDRAKFVRCSWAFRTEHSGL